MHLYFSGLKNRRDAELLRQVGVEMVLVDQFDLKNAAGFKSVVLDSGAYRLHRSGKTLDPDQYLNFLASVDTESFKFILSADVFSDPEKSYQNWEHICTEVLVIPVYHYGAGRDYLDQYLRYPVPLVAIGGLVDPLREPESQGRALRWLRDLLETYNQQDFHILGLNWLPAIQCMKSYPNARSFDTSKFLDGARYRQIIYIDTRGGKPILMQESARDHLGREVERDECVLLCAKALLEFMAL